MAQIYCVLAEVVIATLKLDRSDPRDIDTAEVSLLVYNASKTAFTTKARCVEAHLPSTAAADYTISATAPAPGKRLG